MVNTRQIHEEAIDSLTQRLGDMNVAVMPYPEKPLSVSIEDRAHGFLTHGPQVIYGLLRARNRFGKDTFGYDPKLFEDARQQASACNIPENALYFIAGPFSGGDTHTIEFFIIPFSRLETFRRGTAQYRFSSERCRAAQAGTPEIYYVAPGHRT